jgi:hypothetical protein
MSLSNLSSIAKIILLSYAIEIKHRIAHRCMVTSRMREKKISRVEIKARAQMDLRLPAKRSGLRQLLGTG